MNSSSSIKRKSRVLVKHYQTALHRYLKQGSAVSLKAALRMGQQAVALGLETLDLTLIHEQALVAQVLSMDASSARDRVIKRARTFFAEAIVPIESTHRSALEANVRLSRLNQGLSRRTLDLAASNRQLKKEIARRQVVEETLRQSEKQSCLLLEQSQRLQEQLRFLSRRILLVQEEERKRISRELHDVIAQLLTGINVRLATLKTEALDNTKGLSRKIASAQRLVEKSVGIVHRFARELRPTMLDDLGLIPALHSFMKKFTKETGIRVSLAAFSGVEELNSNKRTALYRVAQEALTNVARHARASHVEVSILKYAAGIRMQIKDDGHAFDVERLWRVRRSRRLGLLGMRERVEMVGGTFTVESVSGRGTTICALVPFGQGSREHSRS
jgi:signal transduction histidine kinase